VSHATQPEMWGSADLAGRRREARGAHGARTARQPRSQASTLRALIPCTLYLIPYTLYCSPPESLQPSRPGCPALPATTTPPLHTQATRPLAPGPPTPPHSSMRVTCSCSFFTIVTRHTRLGPPSSRRWNSGLRCAAAAPGAPPPPSPVPSAGPSLVAGASAAATGSAAAAGSAAAGGSAAVVAPRPGGAAQAGPEAPPTAHASSPTAHAGGDARTRQARAAATASTSNLQGATGMAAEARAQRRGTGLGGVDVTRCRCRPKGSRRSEAPVSPAPGSGGVPGVLHRGCSRSQCPTGTVRWPAASARPRRRCARRSAQHLRPVTFQVRQLRRTLAQQIHRLYSSAFAASGADDTVSRLRLCALALARCRNVEY
jgi:hypothetical protein